MRCIHLDIPSSPKYCVIYCLAILARKQLKIVYVNNPLVTLPVNVKEIQVHLVLNRCFLIKLKSSKQCGFMAVLGDLERKNLFVAQPWWETFI